MKIYKVYNMLNGKLDFTGSAQEIKEHYAPLRFSASPEMEEFERNRQINVPFAGFMKMLEAEHLNVIQNNMR